MLDQLRPLQGTSYELPSLREKVTPDNISLILYSSPIMTCGIPLPCDISYSGYGTSSHKVKVLWCLTLFLINVYDFLTCYNYFSSDYKKLWRSWAHVTWVLLVWVIKVLPVSTEHASLWFLSSWYIFFNIIGLLCWRLRQAEHPMLWPEAALRNLSSCRLTPVRWHPAEAERRPARLLLNGEKRELSCRNRVITVHGVTFSN